jgi:mannose-1-phosphate guanylyltransferase
VVGRGCRVPLGAVVRDAVLWDGTVLAPGERVEGAIAAGVARVRG